MAAAFDRAGFAAVDVHMSDIIAGRAAARRLQGPRRLRRLLATATCSARARAGRSRSSSTRARATSSRLLRARRHVRARRLQRLPDDVGNLDDDHPGRAALAALRAQPLGAVRGARSRWSRSQTVAVALLRRHGGQPHPDRDRARRGPAEFRDAGALDAAQRPRRRALRRQPRQARPSVSRTTRTARRGASPRSRRPTGASRS